MRLLNSTVELRPSGDGEFDELIVHEGADVRAHFEMMDRKCLWIALYPKNAPGRVSLFIRAKKGRLVVEMPEPEPLQQT